MAQACGTCHHGHQCKSKQNLAEPANGAVDALSRDRLRHLTCLQLTQVAIMVVSMVVAIWRLQGHVHRLASGTYS